MSSRRASPAALLTALPACAAGAALLVVAALQFGSSTQPGVDQGDMRPMDNLANGLTALIAGFALLLLGYFAAKRPRQASSLITTACFAVGFALFLLLVASRSAYDATYLGVAAAFAYPAVVALVRLVGLRRAPRG